MNREKNEQECKRGQLYRVAVKNLREQWAWEYKKSAEIPEAEEPRTLYPNLVAEMSTSTYSFCTIADYANVSPEIILAVIQHGEDLLVLERFALANLFSCRMAYLFDGPMQIVDPATNLGAYEDTGLEPESISQLKKILEFFNCSACDTTQLKQIIIKLQSWAEADRKGGAGDA